MSDVGRLIADRYRLTQHIGSGAMGVVWQAHDERLHRTVALKQLLLSPGLSAADANEARERAMREGRIAARLQHPNAVTVYDVVEDDGQPVLIMEYVPSKSLSAVLDERGPLPPQEVARIGAQVATALTAAHTAGIVHRDIKPGNVLLAEDGTVKITDFGISRATGDVTVTATGMLAGTPAYLAPEVAKGENPGPPSDVFSLASTVYAAVEGQPPFGSGDNTLAILHAVAACRTTPPRQAGPLTPVLLAMLRANPDDRPTMSETVRALSAVAAGQVPPTSQGGADALATPPGGVSRAETTVRNWPPHQQPQITMAPMGPPSGPMTPQRGYPGRPGGPPSYPPQQPRPPRPPRSGPPPWRKPVLTALAIIGAAIIGILVANVFVDSGGSNRSAAYQSQSTPFGQAATQPPVTAPDTTLTTSATPTSVSPAASTQSTTPNPATEMMLVQAYCALLPHAAPEAYTLLTPAEQTRSGGPAAYQQTWAAVRALTLQAAANRGDTVVAQIRIITNANQGTDAIYTFTFAQSGGRLLIDNIATTGGGKPPGKHD